MGQYVYLYYVNHIIISIINFYYELKINLIYNIIHHKKYKQSNSNIDYQQTMCNHKISASRVKMDSITNNSMIASSIITGMLENYDFAESQRVGCQALSTFAHNEDNRKMISQEGGIETIIAAMNKFVLNDDVQKEACIAVQCLTNHDAANRTTVASEGGIHSIIMAMKTHQRCAAVQEEGCKALYNLAKSTHNKQLI